MGEIVDINTVFYGEIAPDEVLDAAKAEGLKQVVVLGTTEKGEVYFASSTGSRERIVFLLRTGEFEILSNQFDV